MNSLLEKYNKIRNASIEMCKPLFVEDYVPQAASFASPPKWNLGHTTWFFEEMILKNYQTNYPVFNAKFSFLFNSYYETIGKRVLRAQRGNLSRPTVEEVYQYRKYVDEHMQNVLQAESIEKGLHALIVLGLNHEQQHQELFFTDLKYTFHTNPIFPAYNEIALIENTQVEESEFIQIEEGIYEIGYKGSDFCFDNELGVHKVFLQKFAISNQLVSNGEFIEFIESGAYSNFELWLDDGWTWLKENEITHPLYWHKTANKWQQFTLAGLRDINPKNPLSHINFYEANAFANWKKMRLPTEFEWEVASKKFDWGQRWEWTESAYLPYPNYKKSAGAVGEYNGKFMVNQKVLRGSSVATPSGHERNTYRNFFQAHQSWQFTGIRLVKN